MRVLFLLNSYEEEGPGYLLHRLCERWAPLRELTLQTMALGRGGPLAGRLAQLGIGTEVIPESIARDKRALRALGQSLAARPDCPDIVHSHCIWPDLPARWFRQGLDDIPFLSTVHGTYALAHQSWLSRTLTRMAERRTRDCCSLAVVGNHVLERDLATHGFPAENIRHVPTGIDAVQCFPLADSTKARYRALMGVAEGVPLLLAAGKLIPEKGHDLLLDAMPAILAAHPGTRLFIIGEGPCGGALAAQVARLGLRDSVRLIGQLSDLLLKLLSVADVFVHPSRQEIFSLVVAEAQAAGTPVVATSDGAIPEIVRDGETGLLVPPGDARALADAVCGLLSDPARLEEMGRNAREVMIEYHELGETADGYVELWRKLAPRAEWRSSDSTPMLDLEDFKEDSEKLSS